MSIKVESSRIAPTKINEIPKIAEYNKGLLKPYFFTQYVNPKGILFPQKIRLN